MEHAHCTELKDMLDLVGIKLGELQINDRWRQSSEYAVRNFAKKLYFRPGLEVTCNFPSMKQLDRFNINFRAQEKGLT